MEIGEDKISRLPDSLIHQILSFLDMIDVFRTSALSTRWRYLWSSLSTLNFSSNTFYESTGKSLNCEKVGFVKFLDHVLRLRDNSDIQRFSLNYSESDESLLPECIGSWIDTVVQHNVRELHLQLENNSCTVFPDCLFTCKSLINLTLTILDEQEYHTLRLPDSVMLPGLKTIHLEAMCFEDDTLTSKLFANCPRLESLTIAYCELDPLKELIIDAPRLQQLAIINYPDIECSGRLNEGIVEGIKIRICAPSLKAFVCHELINREFYLCGCLSLEKADVCFASDYIYLDPEDDAEEMAEKKELYGRRLTQFFEGISPVKELTLSPLLLKFVSKPPVILENLPMKLCNLRHLKLGSHRSRDSINGIMFLLKKSPSLETLDLEFTRCFRYKQDPLDRSDEEDKSDPEDVEESWADQLSFPMLHHLKFVEVHNVEGCAIELKFLEILMESALVLERISVFRSEKKSPDAKRRLMKFSKKLPSLSRPSQSLAIFFF